MRKDGSTRPRLRREQPAPRRRRDARSASSAVSLDLSAHHLEITSRQEALEQARARAERLADRNARLVGLSGALGRVTSAEQVVEVVLAQGVEALEVEAGAVLLVERGLLHVAGSTGYEHDLVEFYEGLPVDAMTPLTDVVRVGPADADGHRAAALRPLPGAAALGPVAHASPASRSSSTGACSA